MRCNVHRGLAWLMVLSALAAALGFAGYAYDLDDSDEVIGEVPVILRSVSANGIKSALDDECSLGDAAADAVRLASGADLAILNGGNFQQNLQAGVCTIDDIRRAIAEDYDLVLVTMTAEELWRVLAQGVSNMVCDENGYIDREASAYRGFPQISGFSFICDLSVPEEYRIYSVHLENGDEIGSDDDETCFTVCMTAEMFAGGYGYEIHARESKALDLTVVGALADYISSGSIQKISYEKVSRIHITGCADDRLINSSPGVVVILILILCMISMRKIIWEKLKFRRA